MAFALEDLEALIATRGRSSDDQSYTAKLLKGGPPLSAKKLGEEAVETVIAAIQGDRAAVVNETADLLYHLLVVLRSANIPLAEILIELERRTAQSGIAEKASRPKG